MNTVSGLQKETATVEKTPALKRTLAQKTMDDLSTAMHGEAFAYVKYLFYAERARKNGNTEPAGLVGSDADNLKETIKGESYEVDSCTRSSRRLQGKTPLKSAPFSDVL